ncbi:hypothetical protein ABH309_20135 [Chromobacterium piscinae]|uniref:Uncharacterized protein n=1 Tax=Chromobacterium piscinae TaxID=686831 RepID=A0ABV0H9J8_9NEIS
MHALITILSRSAAFYLHDIFKGVGLGRGWTLALWGCQSAWAGERTWPGFRARGLGPHLRKSGRRNFSGLTAFPFSAAGFGADGYGGEAGMWYLLSSKSPYFKRALWAIYSLFPAKGTVENGAGMECLYLYRMIVVNVASSLKKRLLNGFDEHNLLGKRMSQNNEYGGER